MNTLLYLDLFYALETNQDKVIHQHSREGSGVITWHLKMGITTSGNVIRVSKREITKPFLT